MTTLFEAVLEGMAIQLEQVIVQSGTRGCAIGLAGGDRALVTVVGPNVPTEPMRVHPGWDLALQSIDALETPNGPRTVVIETLPIGIPSVATEGARAIGVRGDGSAPSFVMAAADRVARTHGQGGTVGWLHPALVFVDPRSATLVAIAQRSLRIGAAAPAGEGDAPLFGIAYAAPSDVRNRPSSKADDVHRLAALIWRWRHGTPPFEGLSEVALLHRLAGVAADAPDAPTAAVDAPADELDRLLARALRPYAGVGPTARDLVSAIRLAGAGW